jgi:hypothetical protein
MRTSPKSIVVSGMIAGDPWQGGATWAVLQYLLGFVGLGHKVCFVEPIQALRSPCAERMKNADAARALAESDNATYFRQVMVEYGLERSSALLFSGTKETVGLGYQELRQIAREADLLVNISGLLTDRDLTATIPVRVYLDLDPAFNQLWHAAQGIDMRFAGHTHFVTIGQNIGEPDCPVPTCGLRWLKTFQPIVLERWPVAKQIRYDALTTIGNWRGYGSIEHEGVFYGQKAHSLRRFFALPTLTKEKFMPALAIHPDETKDVAALAANGWDVLDPALLTNTPAKYQEFIQGSKAEFGIAKSGYVLSRCGWFSDRSVCYLASGRPVIAQETGFSPHLPVGEGLFAFTEQEDVLGAIEQLQRDYAKQAGRARAIAQEHFDSDRVLGRFLDLVGA